jgi:hypothetical protein
MFPKTEIRLWPNVSDLAGVEYGIKQGYWGAFALAGLTTVVSLLHVWGADLWSLIDAAVFGLIGLGIRRKWRSAAVVGLILFIGSLAFSLTRGLGIGALGIFILLGFVGAVRGTFAYHRLRPSTKPDPQEGAAAHNHGAAQQ